MFSRSDGVSARACVACSYSATEATPGDAVDNVHAAPPNVRFGLP
jgi:Zn ribbon nucleic-acid-binding protein